MGALEIADADFTPNPHRAIRVAGTINKALEDRFRPQILELTSRSREPITVFIDSEGGSAAAAERILELLRSPNEDGANSCRIICVALSKAWSAAADLLSAGDFAIAHPGSRLLYHGTRITTPQAVTAEHASLLADVLKSSNRRFSASLLAKSAERFMFLLSALRATFEEHRAAAGDRILTDLDCFQEISCRKAPPAAQKVFRQAASIWDGYNGLVTHFEQQAAIARLFGETAEIEKIMLDLSIAFESENQKTDPAWSLRTGGLSRITEHFFFLEIHRRPQLQRDMPPDAERNRGSEPRCSSNGHFKRPFSPRRPSRSARRAQGGPTRADAPHVASDDTAAVGKSSSWPGLEASARRIRAAGQSAKWLTNLPFGVFRKGPSRRVGVLNQYTSRRQSQHSFVFWNL